MGLKDLGFFWGLGFRFPVASKGKHSIAGSLEGFFQGFCRGTVGYNMVPGLGLARLRSIY